MSSAQQHTYSLTFAQSCPPTPDKVEKLPFVIPVELALLNAQGAELPLQLVGETNAAGTTRVLSVTEAQQTFTFVGVPEKPLPSLLRGFSAQALASKYSPLQKLYGGDANAGARQNAPGKQPYLSQATAQNDAAAQCHQNPHRNPGSARQTVEYRAAGG